MIFGHKKPVDRARDELLDIERERFVLEKNMMHDRHRLAFITERRAQLEKEFPGVVAK